MEGDPIDNNLFAQVNNRCNDVMQEIWSIDLDEEPETTLIGDREFNNREWLLEEKKELMDKKDAIRPAVDISGRGNYEA